MTRRWSALTENRLAEALCMAEDGAGRGSVCGTHLRMARVALAHLANEEQLRSGTLCCAVKGGAR